MAKAYQRRQPDFVTDQEQGKKAFPRRSKGMLK
jgi:hypothetical protein